MERPFAAIFMEWVSSTKSAPQRDSSEVLVPGLSVDSKISRAPRWQWLDRSALALIAVYGAVALVGLLLVSRYFLPAEDAVILYQYSQNLARHGAITYYAGGPHAEGATDFAWMVLVACAIRIGIPPFVFGAIANVAALLSMAVLFLRIAQRRIHIVPVLIVCGAVSMLPQIVAAGSGFAVLIDALLLSLMFFAVVRQRAVGASLWALVFCLFRPDGVVFAVPLLLILLFEKGDRGKRFAAVVLCFLIPGIVYFIWRTHYFGALFPLPFSVKSDVHRAFGVFVLRSLASSWKYLLFDGVLLLPLVWCRPLSALSRRLLVGIVVVPTLFYWAMRLDQDVGDRFFYYLPLAAVLILVLNWNMLDASRRSLLLRVGVVAWLVLFYRPLLREFRTFRDYQFTDVEGLAKQLGSSTTRGSLLTTEAGFLAYNSGWVAYDAWGLNTERFAKRFIQADDVVALQPDLIAFHPDAPESCLLQPGWSASYTDRSWPHMTRNLITGAQKAGDYQLWLLSYGSPFYRLRKGWGYGEGDRECFLVHTSSPRYQVMVDALQAHRAVGTPTSTAIEQARLR